MKVGLITITEVSVAVAVDVGVIIGMISVISVAKTGVSEGMGVSVKNSSSSITLPTKGEYHNL